MSSSPHLDLAMVGGGPAGLRIAQQLHGSGARIRVFESLPEVGGRTATKVVDGVHVNTGAVFVYRGTDTDKLCAELGIEYETVEPRTFGIHVNGETLFGTHAEELAETLPLSEEGKRDIRRLVSTLSETYGEHGSTLEGTDHLARVSLSEFIGPMSPEARDFVYAAVAGACVASPDELSAKFGLRYLASFLVRDRGSRGYVPDGMQSICTALYRQVMDLVSLDTTVHTVSANADGSWELVLSWGDVCSTVTADRVVMAVPGPRVPDLVPDLPEWKSAAIAAIPTPPQTILSAVVDCEDRPHWADFFYVVSIGTQFHGITQPRTGDHYSAAGRNRTYFDMFRGRESLDELHAQDDATIIAAWLEDFYTVLPDARGRVTGTYLQRWETAFAFPRFDRLEHVDAARQPVGTMHFAGDYTSETAGSHGALGEADRVVAALRAELER